MLQELVWVLKTLILPPGGVVLLGVIGLMLSRRSFGRFLILIALAALYMLSTPFAAGRLMTGLETYPALTEERIAGDAAQAILVLGGGRYSDAPEYAGDTVSGRLLVRLRYAAWLARKTGLPLFVSGGNTDKEGRAPEAHLARRVLEQEFGVRPAGVEDQSLTTWDNAHFSKRLLQSKGLEKVYLVTHAWHMPRAMAVFQQAGVDAIAAPTAFYHKSDFDQELSDWLPDPRALLYSYYALHEHLGDQWYRLKAYL